MAMATKHEIRKMLLNAANLLQKVADDYVMGRPVSRLDIASIRLTVKTGLQVIDCSWDERLKAHGISTEFPKRR